MRLHENASTRARTAFKSFSEKAPSLFGGKFDYSRVVYLKAQEKVEIICPEHGSFWQTPNNHVNSQDGGCPGCRREKMSGRFRSTEFLDRAKAVHGDRYDYSKVKYRSLTNKVEIVCPDHGSFWQSPANHLKGYGCPSCSGRSVDTRSFIHKARSIHGDRYDYSRVEFVNSTSPVEIICPDHGSFWQSPAVHVNRHSGCPKCMGILVSDTESFIARAKEMHGDKYDYSRVAYVRHDHNVEIICPEHGPFSQTPNTHLRKGVIGCPVCAQRVPKWESELSGILTEWGIEHEQHVKGILPGRHEIDILIPSRKLGIELCGLYWHSHEVKQDSRYHWRKYKAARDAGIELITIFEDEWVHRWETVLNVLQYRLGRSQRGVAARKCEIGPVSYEAAAGLLERHHLQGPARGVHIGAWYEGELVGVMTFGNPTRQQTRGVELKRFVTDGRSHPGLANRLFRFYLKEYEPERVVSFSDNRWFSGSIYETLGFVRDGEIPPDFSYCLGTERFHKSGFRKSEIARKFPDLYQEGLTQTEMMDRTPYTRIFDCGKVRWVWT